MRRSLLFPSVWWLVSLLLPSIALPLSADDWPQWLGPQRDGIWRETGIMEKFPADGPPVRWRTSVNPGYSGPVVVGQRLYMMDREQGPKPQRKPGERGILSVPGTERVLCVDVTNGQTVWEQSYDCAYRIDFPAGPRTTPLVRDGRVFTLGAMGDLLCSEAKSGRKIWARQFLKDFQLTDPPVWGFASPPLLEGNSLISLVGGEGSAVVGFDKATGKELWRALSTREICYAPPIIGDIGGRRQLLVWLSDLVASLDPATGRTNWTLPYPVEGKPQRPEVTIATPRLIDDRLFLTSYYQGSLLLQLGPDKASVLWNRKSTKKSSFNAGLHTVMSTPAYKAGYLYGICGEGELRCLETKTGDRLWESAAVTPKEKGPFPNAFLIEHAGRFFIWNDQGELILARLDPKGFEEISRAKLLETTENARGREVVWSHPAFANRCMYVRSGRELICVSLGAETKG